MTATANARPEIVFIVAVAENGVIGAAGAIPWRLKSDSSASRRMTLGKPVVMGRKTFVSLRRPLPGRTNIVVTRDADYRAAGAVVTTSFDAARAVATGDALRRFATEIAVIGGAEIYAQWMESRGPAGNYRGPRPARGRYLFRRHRSRGLGRGCAGAESGRSGRQRRLFLCDISPTKAALTAFGDVNIDKFRLRHSSCEPTSRVVRAGAVPYKAVQMLRGRASLPRARGGDCRCRGRIKAEARGAPVRKDLGAQARNRRGRGRPISKTFCAAARTGFSRCCRAGISAAWASRSSCSWPW